MSAAPDLDPTVRHTAASRLRNGALCPLDDEAELWALAPLTGRKRDLRAWPEATQLRFIDHYRPLAERRTRRHAQAVPHLVDQDEIDGYAILWLVEAIGTYDPTRGLSFGDYLSARIPQRVQELARSGGSGRYVNDAATALARARAKCTSETQHEPTPADIAAALGGDPTDVAHRLRAVALRQGLRQALEVHSVDIGAVAVRLDGALWTYGDPGVADEPDADLLARDRQRTATEALAQSMLNGDGVAGGDNTRGLWMFAFTELGGHTKRDVAGAGGCGTRTVNTAIHALLDGARRRIAAA